MIDTNYKKEVLDNSSITSDQVAVADLIAKLIEIRNDKGMTQSELAKKTGIRQPNLAKIEGFKSLNISMNTIIKIAEGLDARIEIAEKIEEKRKTDDGK